METVDQVGAEITGPLVIGKVLAYEVEVHSNGKPIRWCQVDVGQHNDDSGSRSVVCGAHSFRVGDFVVVTSRHGAGALRDFSPKDLWPRLGRHDLLGEGVGLGDDHTGILVLDERISSRAATLRRCCTCARKCSTSQSPRIAATASPSVALPARRLKLLG